MEETPLAFFMSPLRNGGNNKQKEIMPSTLKNVAVLSMDEVTKLDQKAAVGLFAEKSTSRARLFVECAKLMIHIRTTLKPNQTVYGLLKKQGVRESTINNGAQAERVWNEYVVSGQLTEKSFDRLAYADCVAINAVTKRRGAEFTAARLADLDEVHFIADTGKTTEEHEAAEAAKSTPAPAPVAQTTPATPEPKKEPAKTEPARTPAVEEKKPEPLIEEKKPDNLIELEKGKPSLADGEKLIQALEATFMELGEDDQLRLAAKLVELTDTVVEFESSIRAKRQVAA